MSVRSVLRPACPTLALGTLLWATTALPGCGGKGESTDTSAEESDADTDADADADEQRRVRIQGSSEQVFVSTRYRTESPKYFH